MVEPTVVEGVPADALLAREEAFGPVMTLAAFDDFNAALRTVNDSCYGLQVGPFSRDIRRMQRAWDKPRGSAAGSSQM